MKILLYSDLHVREEKRKWIEYTLKAIKDIAIQRRVDVIFNGGDTFNTRGLLKTADFDILQSAYQDWVVSKLRQIILIGNHDQEDKEGEIHPMKIFDVFKGWEVIDQPRYLKEFNFQFFPYIFSKKKIEEEILKAPTNCYALVHWGIHGAKMNDFKTDMDGVPVKWLSKFKKVFSGHYHLRNSFENVQYIGSPLQQSFAEKDQEKGVLIFDTESDQIEFVEIEGTPKHREAEICFKDGVPVIDQKKFNLHDIVKVKIKGSSEAVSSLSRSQIEGLTGRSEFLIEREIQEVSGSRLKIDRKEIYDVKSICEKYLEYIQTDLNKEKLLKTVREFI